MRFASAARVVAEAAAEVVAPPPPVDYLKWATENVEFSERESPFKGKYNRALFPLFDEILRALSPDDPCRQVSICKSAQIGGTVIANIFVLGSMDMDPGDIMYTHPTESNAKRWSKMKLAPMLRSTTRLAGMFPQKARDGSDSVLYKERADGRGAIQISGANSAASLSQVTMKRQVQDDLAKWVLNAGGDPETQADSRSRSHEFAKILKISTPLVMPGCRITRAAMEGSQEYPYVPCPHCGEMQVLEWENMAEHLDEDDPDAAHFTCIACGCEILESHRMEMLARAEWRAHNPKIRDYHRSFFIWSAYSVLQSWARIAREWIKAKGDPASEQVFLNDTVGRAYQTEGEAPPWESLRDRAEASPYAIGSIPAGALVLTIGVDCQADRLEWQLVGWGTDYRRWVIAYGVIQGHITEARAQGALDALLLQTWPNAVGRRHAADMLAIDGNAWTEDVWDWVRRHPQSRVIMVRGRGEDNAPLIARVKNERTEKGLKKKQYSRRFFHFGASVLKMALYRNVKKTDPMERGHVGFARGLGDAYFQGLTAERRVAKRNRAGFTVYSWEKDKNQANEPLDTHLQAEAAAIRWGIRGLPDARWDQLAAERESPPQVEPGAQADLEDLILAASAGGAAEPERAAPAAVTPEPAKASPKPSARPAKARRPGKPNFVKGW